MALLDRRLLFVGGKGGVGKSVIAACLALIAAKRGRRVLLVAIDNSSPEDQETTSASLGTRGLSRAADRFSELLDGEPTTATIRRIRSLSEGPGIFAVNLEPQPVAGEFLDVHVPVRALSRQIAGSKLFQTWLDATPMLRELLFLGQSWRFATDTPPHSSRPRWDLVVVEAPATGHSLGLLQSARTAGELLLGPLGNRAREVDAYMRDPATTGLVLTTLPEEMPVNECLELHRVARETLEIPLGPVILNAMPPAEIGPAGAALLSAGDSDPSATLADRAGVSAITAAALTRAARTAAGHSRDRRRAAEERAADLDEGLARPALRLPLLTGARFGFAEIETLAGVLAEQLDRLAEEEGS